MQDFGARFALGGLRGIHAVSDADKLSVDVLHTCGNGILDCLLNLLLDEAGDERLERLVEEVVLRVSNGELESVNFDVDVLDFEDRRFVLASGDEMDRGL